MCDSPVVSDCDENVSNANASYVINDVIFTTMTYLLPPYNFSTSETSTDITSPTDHFDDLGFIVKNIKLLQAIVLCIVVFLLIITMGKFILKVFSSYVHDDRKYDEMARQV